MASALKAPPTSIRADANAARTGPSRLRKVTKPPSLEPQRREREQRDEPRAFDRHRKLPLVTRAIAGGAARYNLAALGDKALQSAEVLVINAERFVGTKATNLATSAPGSAASARTLTPAAFMTVRSRASLIYSSFFICHD